MTRFPRRYSALVTAVALCLLCAAPASADWDYFQRSTGSSIEGYASEVSVLPGGTLHFHVSTNPAQIYRINFYRLGYWGENLSPPRLACVPTDCDSVSTGSPQAAPTTDPNTGEVTAGWPVTDSFTVPSTWRSGYYVAKLTLMGGSQSGSGNLVPFIVREAPGHKAAILVQAAVNTWQAYNTWGGTSLYTPSPHAVKESFDRPYGNVSVGGQSVFDWEEPFARFLEKEGYDVAYTTDRDVDVDPSSLLNRKLVISAGHDEYWTAAQRTAFEAARDAGVNVMFSGANSAYWQVRYEDSGRTIVGYKGQTAAPYGADPQAGTSSETNQFNSPAVNKPECQLIGAQSVGGLISGVGYTYGVASGALTDPWFSGTGITNSSQFPNTVGYEWETIAPGCATTLNGSPVTALLHSDTDGAGPKPSADATVYTAPSGARVFSAGSFQFAWAVDPYGLDANPGRVAPDPGMQQFARKALTDLGGPSFGVITGSTDSITTGGARLKGSVVPAGSPTTYHFEYGTTNTYGQTTPSADAGSGSTAANVTANLSGLAPATTYHYRLAGSRNGFPLNGSDATFTTVAASSPPPPPPPPPPPSGGSPPPPQPPASSPPISTTPVPIQLPGVTPVLPPALGKLTVPGKLSLKRVFAKGVQLSVNAPISGSRVQAALHLTASAAAAKKSPIVTVVRVSRGGTVTLVLRPKSSARRRIGKRRSLVIRITVTPPGGSALAVTRTLRLTR